MNELREYTCGICKKTFKSRGRMARYCSDECRRLVHNQSNSERYWGNKGAIFPQSTDSNSKIDEYNKDRNYAQWQMEQTLELVGRIRI